MAEASGLSQTAVVRIWHAFGLHPHRTEIFKLSTDPLFIERVWGIVGLYLNPPTPALVLRVYEKGQIQALDRTQPALPMIPERRMHHYVRYGTTTVFAVLDIVTREVIGELHCRHRSTDSTEFLKLLRTIDAAVPEELRAHAMMNDCGTHKTAYAIPRMSY